LNTERYIAERITRSTKGKSNISRPIVKIAITGITLGICVMILTISIVLGFKREIIAKITGITSHITITNVDINNSNEPDPLKISNDTLELIKKLDGIASIQSTAVKNGIIKTKKENEGILLKGVGTDYNFSFLKDYITEGDLPVFSDTGVSKQIIISQKIADRLDIKLNDKIIMYFVTRKKLKDTSFVGRNYYVEYEKRSRDFRVCGIFNTGFADFDNNLAFVDIKQIQRLNYWENGEVGAYEINIKEFSKLEDNAIALQELMGYSSRVTPVNDTYSNIFSWLEMVDVNGIIIISLMLLVAGVNMITALLILILERANMIGLIKAMGMNNVRVRKIFFYISMRLLSRGLLFGNITGIGLVLLQLYLHPIKLDSEIYYVEHVPVIFNVWYFIMLNAGTVVCCLLMMFFPTLILTRLTPVKTLRFD
jgi:lipoprotein-releasing system permease protein